MSYFGYQNRELYAEAVPLARIAQQHGTPCYVYSRAALTDAFRAFDAAFADRDHLVCYAVKASSNLAILNLFARLGSGFDIVSGGELERVLAAGGDPRKTVFSGVGKSELEMRRALAAGIFCFNVESASELERLDRVAGDMGKTAPVSLRVNPDVDAGTHPYIATGLKQNKFGVPYRDALALYRRAAGLPHLKVEGIGCHIGSQLTDVAPFAAALERILDLVDRLQRESITISHIDAGGGLGIRYQDETPPGVGDYARALLGRLGSRRHALVLEPGRALTGNAGLLLTRVEYLKHGEEKNFAVVDAAMNDLLRPALYDAWHEVLPVTETDGVAQSYEVVGPVCESGDFLARDRSLKLREGDLLAIMSAGAYGMSMSSNYNTRPRPAEVVVDGAAIHLIRKRERIAELMADEILLP
ncbi:MAG: diaminopimelate decarboxylase [Betaproteobacteria bacterium]|nr:diaminopimelate decarboxylase [Betaproteobacteria bacterium]